jgi:hypothetical protein
MRLISPVWENVGRDREGAIANLARNLLDVVFSPANQRHAEFRWND